MADYSNVSFKNNGKLKLLIIVGTRPEIIRLAAVINKTRKYFDVILAHTGQNYDYNLNGVFFHDLQLADPEVYMNAVGADLGETMGNIIAESYKLMVAIQLPSLGNPTIDNCGFSEIVFRSFSISIILYS